MNLIFPAPVVLINRLPPSFGIVYKSTDPGVAPVKIVSVLSGTAAPIVVKPRSTGTGAEIEKPPAATIRQRPATANVTTPAGSV